MKVEVRQVGGLAGVVETVAIDTRGLPATTASRLADLADAVLGTVADPAPTPRPDPAPHPDQQACSITVDRGGSVEVREFTGAPLPPAVVELVASVRATPGSTVELGPPNGRG